MKVFLLVIACCFGISLFSEAPVDYSALIGAALLSFFFFLPLQ